MTPWLFLAASLAGLAFSLSALRRAKHLWAFIVPYFFAGWLTSELALHHIAWQAVATLVFAAFGALAAWPGILGLAITFVSWGCLLAVHRRAHQSAAVLREALREHDVELDLEIPGRVPLNPLPLPGPGVERISDIAYGEALPGDRGGRNLLDVFRPATGCQNAPVLLQIHGGAWIIGEKEWMGQPLMHHLAERGWICVAPNYRLGPEARLPAAIIDIKRAIAWIRAHIREYGGDPGFICVSGGSAGGHLSAIAALTANDPAFQPDFEDVDTRLAAAVPIFGVYDLLDRTNHRGRSPMTPFLESRVMPCSAEADPALWESISPISRVDEQAPPFLVIHGTHDSLSFVEDGRLFVEALREKSRSPAALAELPGAQHAFETFHSLRCAHTVRAIGAFLDKVHAEYSARGEPDAG